MVLMRFGAFALSGASIVMRWQHFERQSTLWSAYGVLTLRSTKQTKTSITLKWNKPRGATSFVLYGNKCGKSYKMKKIGTYAGKSKKLTKVVGAKVKKGTYYKFILVALDKDGNVVSTSKVIHVASKGGKATNPKKVTVK